MGSEELYDTLFNERKVTRDGILPCPFCAAAGASAKIMGRGEAVATCPQCEAYGPWMESGYTAALNAWDTRDLVWTGNLSAERRGIKNPHRLGGKKIEGYLPCPFCGSEKLMNTLLTKISGGTECDDCGAAGPLVPFTPETLKAAWNSRNKPQ